MMKNSKWLTFAVSGFVLVFSGSHVQAQDTNGIQFQPERINFSTVVVDACRPRKIEATNQTGSAILNPEFNVVESDAFYIQGRFKCPNPLEPGETCRGYVNFCPSYYGIYEGALVFTGSKQRIPLIGEGKGTNSI